MGQKVTPSRAAAEAVVEAGFGFMRYVRDQARTATFDDLSLPEVRFLGILAKEPERPLSEIADFLCVTPAAITKLADGLEARGLVTRAPGAGDRRRVLVVPTAKGHELLMRVKSRLLDGIAARLEDLPAAQLANVVTTLHLVREQIVPGATTSPHLPAASAAATSISPKPRTTRPTRKEVPA